MVSDLSSDMLQYDCTNRDAPHLKLRRDGKEVIISSTTIIAPRVKKLAQVILQKPFDIDDLLEVIQRLTPPSWTAPDTLTEALRGSVASWARAGKHIMATQQMNTVSRFTLPDAMAIVLHITHEPGTCHYCSYPLTGEATDHCPFCKAVNYDW